MIQRETININAAAVSLGRVATQAARILMGKHKPNYLPNEDKGDFVEISDLDKIKFTGSKMKQKLYYRPTTRVGALKSDSLAVLWQKNPKKVLWRAVWGMLPKNSLRREMIKRLIIK